MANPQTLGTPAQVGIPRVFHDTPAIGDLVVWTLMDTHVQSFVRPQYLDTYAGYVNPATQTTIYAGFICVDIKEIDNRFIDVAYQSLPGSILSEIIPDPELGIPILTWEQRRSFADSWRCGEILPTDTDNIFSIGGATAAASVVLQVANHNFFPGEYVVVTGTSNTTPTINTTNAASRWLVTAITSGTVTLQKTVTLVSGVVGGTIAHYSELFVQRQKTESINIVRKVVTLAAVQDITTYNDLNGTIAFRPYPFPDALSGIRAYKDTTTGTGAGTTWSISYSWSAGIDIRYEPGFRGDCQSTRLRVFSMGPVTAMPINPATSVPYAPTIILLTTGSVVVEGGAFSESLNDSEETTSNSVSFKTFRIEPCLRFPFGGAIVDVGTGTAVANLSLGQSYVKDSGSAPRSGFVQGDIITAIDPPEKLRGIGVYLTTIWLIVCPYTTGAPPATRVFTFTGNNGAGNITVPGISMHDTIAFIVNRTLGTTAINDFIIDVSINDTVTQTSMDNLSGDTFLIGVI